MLPKTVPGSFFVCVSPVLMNDMHYTSPENIHKVIDPLFLDDLWEEFHAIKSNEELSPVKRNNQYRKLHKKICSLKFLEICTTSLIRVAAA